MVKPTALLSVCCDTGELCCYLKLNKTFTLALNRIERLWRDVYTAVTCFFYSALHQAEEDGLLESSSHLHLFCCHYVFIPRLQARLEEFKDGWDNHPLSTERNRTPNQLWFLGQYHNSADHIDEVHACLSNALQNCLVVIIIVPILAWLTPCPMPDNRLWLVHWYSGQVAYESLSNTLACIAKSNP